MKKTRLEDTIGSIFGRLTVTGLVRIDNKAWHVCICDCGNQVTVRRNSLTSGESKSCGCIAKEGVTERNKAKSKNVACENTFLSQYKLSAKKRNLQWGLSRERFIYIVYKPCFYCGKESSLVKRAKNQIIKTNGVDRLDNKIGYTVENSVPCCRQCNRAKFVLSQKEFLDWANQLVEHQRKQANPPQEAR